MKTRKIGTKPLYDPEAETRPLPRPRPRTGPKSRPDPDPPSGGESTAYKILERYYQADLPSHAYIIYWKAVLLILFVVAFGFSMAGFLLGLLFQ